MKYFFFIALIACLLPAYSAAANTSTSVLISIAPSEMTETIGKDGLPLSINPRLTFSGLDDSIAKIELTSSTKGAPTILFATSTSFGTVDALKPFQFTVFPPTSTNAGTYDYQWRILFSSTGSNISLGLPFKLSLEVTSKEADITKPYTWNDGTSKIITTSPLKRISLASFIFLQRDDEKSRINLEAESTYPRNFQQIPLESSVTRFRSLSSLQDELVSTSTLNVKTGITNKPIVLPPLPIGMYKATVKILDQSATEFLIVTPKYTELAAIAVIPAGLILAWVLTRKKKT